jgi:hypothetical protein
MGDNSGECALAKWHERAASDEIILPHFGSNRIRKLLVNRQRKRNLNKVLHEKHTIMKQPNKQKYEDFLGSVVRIPSRRLRSPVAVQAALIVLTEGIARRLYSYEPTETLAKKRGARGKLHLQSQSDCTFIEKQFDCETLFDPDWGRIIHGVPRATNVESRWD